MRKARADALWWEGVWLIPRAERRLEGTHAEARMLCESVWQVMFKDMFTFLCQKPEDAMEVL